MGAKALHSKMYDELNDSKMELLNSPPLNCYLFVIFEYTLFNLKCILLQRTLINDKIVGTALPHFLVRHENGHVAAI